MRDDFSALGHIDLRHYTSNFGEIVDLIFGLPAPNSLFPEIHNRLKKLRDSKRDLG